MEMSEKEFKEIYSLIKKGFIEHSGLNILDFNKMTGIAINHGYTIDDNLNIIDGVKYQCAHENKILMDAGWVCTSCKTILSKRR